MTITLLQGDCREVLATLPEKSVQCCVTSPPYFGLRRYDVDGAQIGLEQTPAEYVAALVEVFRQVRRVLRDDGVLWVNLGDSYAGSGVPGKQSPTANLSRHGSNGHNPKMAEQVYGRAPTPAGLAEKNLLGIPWRVAFALQDNGWILRSDIIWHKPNPMPESVTDRPTRAHEYLFLFAKQARYFYDAAAIAEEGAPVTAAAGGWQGRKLKGQTTTGNGQTARGAAMEFVPGRRNRRTVWTVATRPYKEAHFATFPEALIEPCILAGSAAQACEHCGAPWERETEKEQFDRTSDRLYGGTLGHNPSGKVPGSNTRGMPDRAVLSSVFRPTCACPNEGRARSIVLDPFVGSGTTARVAEKFGRDSIGIDLGYAELQKQRTDGIQTVMLDVL